MDALSAGRIEVVAMSYDLMRSFANQLKGILFDAVLFDEFHTLKSSRAMVSRAASELRTSRVFGLTGTLIQNDAKELWALMHLIDPLAMGEKVRRYVCILLESSACSFHRGILVRYPYHSTIQASRASGMATS